MKGDFSLYTMYRTTDNNEIAYTIIIFVFYGTSLAVIRLVLHSVYHRRQFFLLCVCVCVAEQQKCTSSTPLYKCIKIQRLRLHFKENCTLAMGNKKKEEMKTSNPKRVWIYAWQWLRWKTMVFILGIKGRI